VGGLVEWVDGWVGWLSGGDGVGAGDNEHGSREW